MDFFLVTQNQSDTGQSGQFGRRPLSVTSGDPDRDSRKFTGETADGLAGLLVGTSGDSAGVDQVQVGGRPRRGVKPALVG